MFRYLVSAFVALTIGTLLLTSCGTSGNPPGSSAATPAGISAPSTATPSAGVATSQPKGKTLSDILPPGKGLTLLLNNCATCHSPVCAVKGQRPVGRWESLKKDHKDKATGLSEADFDTLFSYLADNFNSTKPEPNLPAELAQQGSCTPF